MTMTTGSLIALAGITLLAYAWQTRVTRPARRHQLLRGGAIGLLALSVAVHAQATGWDRAVALALLAMMLTAGVLLAAVACCEWRSRRPVAERVPDTASPWPDRGRLARVAWIALLAGPVSGTAAVATAAAINQLATGLAAADRVGLATLLAPLLWAGLAATATYDWSLPKRSLAVTGALVAALVLVWLSPRAGV